MGRQIHLFIEYKSPHGTHYRIETLPMWVLWSLRGPHCLKYGTFLSPGKDIYSGHTISSAFSEHFCFGRLDEISIFYAVYPPLMFLLKALLCSYVNYNGFHKHEGLFMIMAQQVPKRWNISLNLSEYVLQLSTPWEKTFANTQVSVFQVTNFPEMSEVSAKSAERIGGLCEYCKYWDS